MKSILLMDHWLHKTAGFPIKAMRFMGGSKYVTDSDPYVYRTDNAIEVFSIG